ncbi:hypothetical protein Q8F55_003915 [Vanrija albida]|uniref:Uncharacterized protein n=1 Tax=Vanrija albida TaxID=181172 RepID=A0ABR3Q5A2_9TREE
MFPARDIPYKESELEEGVIRLQQAGFKERSAGAIRWRITHKLHPELKVAN